MASLLALSLACITQVVVSSPNQEARQYASFVDVPNGHWAAGAVRDLKDAGVLVGYPPSKAPQFDPPRAFDRKFILRSIKRWKVVGLLVGYPDGYHSPPIEEESPYQFAVLVNALLYKLRWIAEEGWFFEGIIDEVKAVETSVRMLEKELDSLGAKPNEMLLQLKELADQFSGNRFRGGANESRP